jgi:hypothetical protein
VNPNWLFDGFLKLFQGKIGLGKEEREHFSLFHWNQCSRGTAQDSFNPRKPKLSRGELLTNGYLGDLDKRGKIMSVCTSFASLNTKQLLIN